MVKGDGAILHPLITPSGTQTRTREGRRPDLQESTFRVLVVEDYESWRRFFCSTLQKEPDLQVISEVSDGQEAVEKAQALEPDLILLDISLPTLNGIGAARRIRDVSPTSKILFVTENRSMDVAEEALSLEHRCRRLRTQVGCRRRTTDGCESGPRRKAVHQRQLGESIPRGYDLDYYPDNVLVDGYFNLRNSLMNMKPVFESRTTRLRFDVLAVNQAAREHE